VKALGEFVQRKKNKDGRTGVCLSCNREYTKLRRKVRIARGASIPLPPTKQCAKCGANKPLEAFAISRDARFGRHSICRDCCSIITKARYSENRDEILAAFREKSRTETQKLLVRDRNLKRTKRISFEEKRRMLESQGNKCRVCKNPLQAEDKTAHVDHCHTSNVVRGILCRSCNLAIGLFYDSSDNMRRAADYIDEAKQKSHEHLLRHNSNPSRASDSALVGVGSGEQAPTNPVG
jgi:hypothetical protein